MRSMFIMIFVFTVCCLSLIAQSKVEHRVILIGDAGEINTKQLSLIEQAATLVLASKTTTVFLGDNVYPYGIGLPGSKTEEKTKDILRRQFKPFRSKNAAVYFIPGNHDWDKSGKKGLEKVKQQSKFIDAQGDSLLKFIPANGCPDPTAIELSPNLVLIAYDSEWWLGPYKNENPSANCTCKTKSDVISSMKTLRDKNYSKQIVLASHHPFRSYGVHGAYFTLKDHLFPLTAVRDYLYIPMPGIGSLYPLLRKLFVNPEDMKHPLYKDMINRVSDVFKGTKGIIYASGHEHGLQLIKDSILQVVSGSGSKSNAVKKRRYSLFISRKQGFAVLDLMEDKKVILDFYILKDGELTRAFRYEVPVVSPDNKK